MRHMGGLLFLAKTPSSLIDEKMRLEEVLNNLKKVSRCLVYFGRDDVEPYKLLFQIRHANRCEWAIGMPFIAYPSQVR